MNDCIDLAQFRLGLSEQGLHVGRVTYVRLDREGVPALGGDLRYHLISPGRAARIMYDHGEAIGCQAQRDSAADATGCAGDQRDTRCSRAQISPPTAINFPEAPFPAACAVVAAGWRLEGPLDPSLALQPLHRFKLLDKADPWATPDFGTPYAGRDDRIERN
jgi:hypothetical protein